MLRDQSGVSNQSDSSKKKGRVRICQPILKPPAPLPWSCRFRAVILRNSIWDPAALAEPRACQTVEQGSTLWCVKTPPPAILLRGDLSLKRNSPPGLRAWKLIALGAQKLTSCRFGSLLSLSNQLRSVTATTQFTSTNGHPVELPPWRPAWGPAPSLNGRPSTDREPPATVGADPP